MANGININRNDTIRGSYMGNEFTGRVSSIETDASGYAGTQNDCRVFIQLDADMWDARHEGWKRREAGEAVIMLGELRNGLFTRTDSKFEWARITSAKRAA